jgi:PAS domain S-box-containing protein
MDGGSMATSRGAFADAPDLIDVCRPEPGFASRHLKLSATTEGLRHMASESENALRQQGVLARFGEFALRSDNLDDILTEACRLVGDALGTELSKVLELQDDGITLRVKAGVGWPRGVVGVATAKAEIGSSEGYAIQTGKPVTSSNIANEDRFEYAQFIKDAGVRALVNVVIIGPEGRQPYGVLQVDSRTPREFTEADTDFLRSYANLLAAAVERLRVLAQTRRSSASLRESEERYRTLATQIPQLVFRSKSSGERTWGSPQWVSYAGMSEEASVGLGWMDAVHPQDREATTAAWAASESVGQFSVEHRIRRASDGTYRWFQSRATPVRGGRGLVEWLGTSTDIDDQIRAREALARSSEELEARVAERTEELQEALDTLHDASKEREQAEERLRQSEKLKAIGQLTGGIAHDFNNMLQAITSSLSMIRTRLQQGRISEVTAFVERAERGAMRAANLTHRLLAFGRLQTLAPKLVSLDKIAIDMEDMIRRTVGPAVQVELKLADGDWLVMCDPNQMESALLNLCINARDAMSDGGWLTISTAEIVLAAQDLSNFEEALPGRYTAIAVSDTGSGMAPEVVEHVFEPFFTTKPSGQGTGLGLSQIYGFVRQSGGVIQIETQMGKGTTIRLCLPSYGQGENSETTSVSKIGKTLLLIEDEADVREVTAEQLRDLGYRVLEADSAAAALRLVQAGTSIDLLISDVALPGGMNGRQVAEAVRGRHPGLPVILITGYSAGESIMDMEVIRKPFDPAVLAERVGELVQPKDFRPER